MMPEQEKIYPLELFLTFSRLSLMGFGGVLPWVYREIVENKKWLDPREFGELLSLGQILPGANVTNLSAMLGYRYAGLRGAAAALTGLFLFPSMIVISLGALYNRYGQVPMVQGALKGITAVVIGMVIMTGVKLAMGQPRTWRALVLGLAALAGVGILGFPLIAVVLALAPIALALEWKACP